MKAKRSRWVITSLMFALAIGLFLWANEPSASVAKLSFQHQRREM